MASGLTVLAHRGLWTEPSEKNSLEAIERAFAAGFGVETDVRDHDGRLVLSHDMPTGDRFILFERVLELFAKHGCPGALAINIKADGLHVPLKREITKHDLKRTFVFDMSVPDARGYLSHGMTVFTRQSEIEWEPAFYSAASGVWLDCFERDWITATTVRGHRRAGKQVALVSPELHGRDPYPAWDRWREIVGAEELMLCTDLPYQAMAAIASNEAASCL